MVVCGICGMEQRNIRGLAQHIFRRHDDYDRESYYNEFIKLTSPYCYCGNKNDFRGLGRGYLKYCSRGCHASSDENKSRISSRMKGKKQSRQTIEKRIKNTDQVKKERKRKETFMNRYGVGYVFQLDSVKAAMSLAHKGTKKPRTAEHQRNIIESKRRNGTIYHSKKTRSKISKAVNAAYNSDNPPVTVSNGSSGRHKTGYYNGIYFRSSYELLFIIYCNENEIDIESAESKKFRIPYEYNGKSKMYYPDFYLPHYNSLVEIKPISMLDHGATPYKTDVALRGDYPYYIVTEEELSDLDELFLYM